MALQVKAIEFPLGKTGIETVILGSCAIAHRRKAQGGGGGMLSEGRALVACSGGPN